MFGFEASHRLINPRLSVEKNKKIYGKCYDCISHGHSYKFNVTIGGVIDSNGMIINFTDLKKIVNKLIIEKVDHKFLNEEVTFLKNKPTTCENMVIQFWKILDDYLTTNNDNIFLKRLELWETEDSKATIGHE
jgi:6-pyruvoyltetrahydropterin/6-carboxytetrahydropterin synthase